MNRTPTEDKEQEALFEWLDLIRVPAFAIPNGGKRSAGEAAHMKRCGVRAGVPDIFLPVPRRYYHGLFVEMKRTQGGRLSDAQREWLDRLQRLGYAAEVCRGFDEAKKTIEEYLR